MNDVITITFFFYDHLNTNPGLKPSSYSNLENGLKPVLFHLDLSTYCHKIMNPFPQLSDHIYQCSLSYFESTYFVMQCTFFIRKYVGSKLGNHVEEIFPYFVFAYTAYMAFMAFWLLWLLQHLLLLSKWGLKSK